MSLAYIRCPSCGKEIGSIIYKFENDMKDVINNPKLTDDERQLARQKLILKSGLGKYCCRTRLMGHRDLTELIQ